LRLVILATSVCEWVLDQSLRITPIPINATIIVPPNAMSGNCKEAALGIR